MTIVAERCLGLTKRRARSADSATDIARTAKVDYDTPWGIGKERSVKIAAAISEGRLAGLDDATTLTIYDTETGATEDVANPAAELAVGKRLAAVEVLLAHDVDILAAVPDGLCNVSHAIARAADIRFLPLERGTDAQIIARHGATLAAAAQQELPPAWLATPARVDAGAPTSAWLSDEATGAVRNRLRRLEGQARGVQRMLDERAALDDILTQLSAMRSALNAVGLTLLAENLVTCLSMAGSDPEGADRLAAARRAFLRLN